MSSDNEQKLYEVAIGLIPGVGNMLTKQLISYCGSPKEVFTKSKTGLKHIPNIGEVVANQIINSSVLKLAEQELIKAEKHGVNILFYTNSDYPDRLKLIADAPTLLYTKGKIDLNISKSVAIVGTREATAYGREITENIVQDLVAHNALIVSGLAYGIDIAAHKAAHKFNLQTVGVMASGIDIIYPAVHKNVAADIQNNGGLISENKFGTIPDAPRFPARNRIIAGLADVLIVVEAAEKGGALITAEIANTYNKDVFAVPGRINDKFSLGCNKLINSHKAHIFTTIANMVSSLNWDQAKSTKLAAKPKPDLVGEELVVFDMMQLSGEIILDELAWKTQLNVNRLSSVLLSLEFAGIVKAMPGKKFKIIA